MARVCSDETSLCHTPGRTLCARCTVTLSRFRHYHPKRPQSGLHSETHLPLAVLKIKITFQFQQSGFSPPTFGSLGPNRGVGDDLCQGSISPGAVQAGDILVSYDTSAKSCEIAAVGDFVRSAEEEEVQLVFTANRVGDRFISQFGHLHST